MSRVIARWRRKRVRVGVLALSLALASATGAAGAVDRSATSSVTTKTLPRLVLRPSITSLGQRSGIVVTHVRARSLQMLLRGATDESGKLFPWQPLRLVNGSWVGSLPAPALLGVYPILLRTSVGAPPFGSPRWLLRVFDPGTDSRPLFGDPIDVVDWWVRTGPRETLVAMKEWPLPTFDRRDPGLHRLFVVAYTPAGDPDVHDRLGAFVTAVRDSYGGRWRFLEAALEPLATVVGHASRVAASRQRSAPPPASIQPQSKTRIGQTGTRNRESWNVIRAALSGRAG
jgi:hypothetical protein